MSRLDDVIFHITGHFPSYWTPQKKHVLQKGIVLFSSETVKNVHTSDNTFVFIVGLQRIEGATHQALYLCVDGTLYILSIITVIISCWQMFCASPLNI